MTGREISLYLIIPELLIWLIESDYNNVIELTRKIPSKTRQALENDWNTLKVEVL